jgi:hypothetical protein
MQEVVGRRIMVHSQPWTKCEILSEKINKGFKWERGCLASMRA